MANCVVSGIGRHQAINGRGVPSSVTMLLRIGQSMTTHVIHPDGRPDLRDWRDGLLAGAILGTLFLGIGSRLGMRLIALAEGRSPAFSLGGSLTIVLLGTGVGALVASLFLISRTLFPRRRLLRVTFFGALTGAIVLRGLNPVSFLNAGVFLPLFAMHAALLTSYWCRWRDRGGNAQPR